MNQDNQNPEITNPSTTNSYSNSNIPSGFTPANAVFNGDNSSANFNTNPGVLNNLSDEAIEDMEVQKTEAINRNLDNQLGLVYPSDMKEEEQILYKAFFGIMRNMYKWEMLTVEYIKSYYQKFQPLNLSQKQTINRDLEEIYRSKKDENLLLQQYFDAEEDDEAWQDIFDSLDAEGQEKLIYYVQTGQQMPADILAKVKAQLEGEEVTDQEASAFAQKNIQKILSRGGFSASTLTSKDISDIVNSGSNNSVANPSPQPRPVSPQIPVRVPQRAMPPVNSNLNNQQTDNSGLGQSNNQNFAGNTNDQVTNNQNNMQPSQLGQEFSNNNAGNNFSKQQPNQSQNVPDTMPFDQAKNLMGNTQFNQPRNSNNSNQNFNSDQNTGSKLQNLPGGRTFPKPIGGISHLPKGLDDLLNKR